LLLLLSQQVLDVIKRVVGNNFVFQQDSTLMHSAHNIVQLLQRETLNFLSL